MEKIKYDYVEIMDEQGNSEFIEKEFIEIEKDEEEKTTLKIQVKNFETYKDELAQKEELSKVAEEITEDMCELFGVDFIEVRHTEEYFSEDAQNVYNAVYNKLEKNFLTNK